MAKGYEDRMMSDEGPVKAKEKDYGRCPKCGAPRLYAKELRTDSGTHRDVVYCTNGACLDIIPRSGFSE